MTTSINFHLRPSRKEGRHKGKLYIRIICARKCKHISTDYSLYSDEWDSKTRKIIFSADSSDDPGRHYRLSLIRDSVNRDLDRLKNIVSQLGEKGNFSAGDVARQFIASRSSGTVSGYARIASAKLRESGQERTARAYHSAARSLTGFNRGRDIRLSEITPSLIRAYEEHLIVKGLKLNTVSFYIRNIRALYFRAMNDKLIVRPTENPFAGVHTGVYETRRRALSSEQLKTLAALDNVLSEKSEERKTSQGAVESGLSENSELHDSLLYFLFCYHARGMSFVDMAHLKKQDVGKETLFYRRRKTGRQLEVKITKPMRCILAHFQSRMPDSTYVFPVINPSRGNAWRQYEAGLKRQNYLLKTLASMSGIEDSLSTHAARHTWATTAKRLKYPVEMICEALGHRETKTTRIYLASFERSEMDELSVKVSAAVRAA